MGSESGLTIAEMVPKYVSQGKSSVRGIKQYVEEEGRRLTSSSDIDVERLTDYCGVLTLLYGTVGFIRDRFRVRTSTERETYRSVGSLLDEERRRLKELDDEVKQLEKLLRLSCSSNELDYEAVVKGASAHNDMVHLAARRVTSQERSKNTTAIGAEPPPLPIQELAPGPSAASSSEAAPTAVFSQFGNNATSTTDDDAVGIPTYKFDFGDTVEQLAPPAAPRQRTGGGGDVNPSSTASLTFRPRHKVDYTPEEWAERESKVGRCSSIGEMLRLFIGTEILASGAPMELSQLDGCVKERLLLTSSKVSPLWRCTFSLPADVGNSYIFPEGACDDPRGRYVTQTKAYSKKLKCRQIAFFRAAMTLYPDETAYYRTLQRSDSAIAKEAEESPFEFTDSSKPFTAQLTSAYGEELSVEVSWRLEQIFATVDAVMPSAYRVTLTTSGETFENESADSVTSAFVGAMIKAEANRECSNFTEAMWLEFLQLVPPVMNTGQEVTMYLFDHFFGVKEGRESALVLQDEQEGTAWRSTLRLFYSPSAPDTVTLASAVGPSKKAAQTEVYRDAAVRNFLEVFTHISQADPKTGNKIAIQYAKEILKYAEELGCAT